MDTRLKIYRKRANHQSENTYRLVQAISGAGTAIASSAFTMSAIHEIVHGDKVVGTAHAIIGATLIAFGTAEILGSRRERRQRTVSMLRREAENGDTTALVLLSQLKR